MIRHHYLEVVQGASELLQAAAGQSSGGQEALRVRQEPLQLPQAVPVEVPVPDQTLHQGAPLVRTLHRPMPVLPELRQLQDEVASDDDKRMSGFSLKSASCDSLLTVLGPHLSSTSPLCSSWRASAMTEWRIWWPMDSSF